MNSMLTMFQQHDSNGSPQPANEQSNFVEDYDPGHQEQEDTRTYHEQQQQYQNQHYVNGNTAYDHQQYPQQDQQWNERDVYNQRGGLFDKSSGRPPEEEEDLW